MTKEINNRIVEPAEPIRIISKRLIAFVKVSSLSSLTARYISKSERNRLMSSISVTRVYHFLVWAFLIDLSDFVLHPH